MLTTASHGLSPQHLHFIYCYNIFQKVFINIHLSLLLTYCETVLVLGGVFTRREGVCRNHSNFPAIWRLVNFTFKIMWHKLLQICTFSETSQSGNNFCRFTVCSFVMWLLSIDLEDLPYLEQGLLSYLKCRYHFHTTQTILTHNLVMKGKVWIQLFSFQLWVNSRTD